MSAMDKHIDLFDAYERDLLSGPDREAFHERLTTDEKFKTAFEQYQHELKVIRAVSAGEEMRALMEAGEPKKEQPALMRYLIPMGVAAALALLFFVFAPDKQPSSPELFDEYFEAFPNLISARDNTDNLSEALRAYSQADFEAAIKSLQKITPKSDTVIFYRSISHLAMSESKEALQGLNRISAESPFYESALWYQGLAHLLLNQPDSVNYYLNKAGLNSTYGKNAQEIIKALD